MSKILSDVKVVHIITGLGRGGAENALYRLLSARENSEKTCVVSLTDDGFYGNRLRSIGVEVISLGMRRNIPSPFVIFRLSRILRKINPQVAQTWMYHADLIGGIAARCVGIKVCWGIRHSNLSPRYNKFTTLIVVLICAVLSHFIPSLIISCSRRAILVHRRFLYAKKFIVIPNGIDLNEYSPSRAEQCSVRGEIGLPPGVRVLGHIGRADPQKDHLNLISSFSRLLEMTSGVYLVLVGKGLASGDPYLEALLDRYDVRDYIIAMGPQNDIPMVMRSFDVFVLSSVGEAFPNVVVEAMACGIPCVATDVGDVREIVGNNGWVVPPSDSFALSAALREALGEPSSRLIKLCEAARKSIEDRYSIGGMVLAYEKAWKSVCQPDE
ncbi:glycosyltransferase family 4 protein [Rhodanobacter sp. 115]|uniref:glycosyltransferase family 4 protein n=1 Tax=Rhodanobacter sp. FW021-MT20 TaxID=1162282 RepID=UPI0034E51DC1